MSLNNSRLSLVIGLTGGIGAGKSVVARCVEAMGNPVYDCDSRAKALMDSRQEILDRIAAEICADAVVDGVLDRQRLSKIVFTDAEALARLNTIVHQAVKDDIKCWIADNWASPLLFIESAILESSGLTPLCDAVWEVTAPESLRIERACSRSGLTTDEVKARISAQTTNNEKFMEIVNDGVQPLLPQILEVMPSPRAALFDLDGVIVDSEGSYTVFWAGIDRAHPTGIPDFAHAIKGTALFQILQNFPDEELQRQIVDQLNEFEANMTFEEYPGAFDFIRSLRQAGWRTALVTSSNDAKMASLYRQHPHLPLLFDTIVTSDQITRSKPDPQGYILAAERLGCEPENCVVFEDSIQGVQAGRASGAKVVGISTTNPAEALAPFCDIIAGSLQALALS
ncbi:MAG: dephospho-CoA kinase [Bacteroidales bacterium]|nr:dephospho-CoA kinase [Bacteroidales bacterium]